MTTTHIYTIRAYWRFLFVRCPECEARLCPVWGRPFRGSIGADLMHAGFRR
jgi:hypothetical protein